jgi:hypothetical protein
LDDAADLLTRRAIRLKSVELFDLVWRRIRDEMAADPVIEAPELRPSQLRVRVTGAEPALLSGLCLGRHGRTPAVGRTTVLR